MRGEWGTEPRDDTRDHTSALVHSSTCLYVSLASHGHDYRKVLCPLATALKQGGFGGEEERGGDGCREEAREGVF